MNYYSKLKKIALYEEQKDSIIYEVVTKGLNNNVKFKKVILIGLVRSHVIGI